MNRASPPGKRRAASVGTPKPRRENQNLTGTIPTRPPPVKRLLAQWGTVWLFEVTLNKRISYFVEQNERRFGFTLLYSAEAKFERLARKEGYN